MNKHKEIVMKLNRTERLIISFIYKDTATLLCARK